MKLYAKLAAMAVIMAGLVGCSQSETYRMAQNGGWNHFGGSMGSGGKDVSLGSLGGGENNVVVEATITEVCTKKGCWMNVVDSKGNTLHVKFKDYGFFVPMNAAGHKVVMHGLAIKQNVSVADLQHMAEDAGKSKAEIAQITEDQELIMFFADSVYIDGMGLDAPYSN